MQDIHSIGSGGGGGARLFGGVGGGGDRRLRPHGHHHQNNQALKCPRCDSLNTKFCYYNNYNLSQPRHFCKSCRRYWTKGGVLRNVPVGGGCRKTKRSKPKQVAAAAPSLVEAATAALQEQQQEDVQQSLNNNNNDNNNNEKSSNSHSSSESSSLTATNTTANTAIEAISSKATTPTNNNNIMLSGRIEVETSKLFSANPSFEQAIYDQYPDIGSFTGLMSTSSSENMPFGFGNAMNQQTTSVQVEQQQGLWQGGFDQTVQNELRTMQNSGSRGGESGGGFGSLDWQGSGDQGLFDIPNGVDQAYWTQNQWSGDQDHHPGLYLP